MVFLAEALASSQPPSHSAQSNACSLILLLLVLPRRCRCSSRLSSSFLRIPRLPSAILRPLLPRITPRPREPRGNHTLDALCECWPPDRLLDHLSNLLFQPTALLVHGNPSIERSAFPSAYSFGIFVFCAGEHFVELAAGDAPFALILEVEFFAEGFGEAADHVATFDGVHVLGEVGVDGGVVVPGGVVAFRVVEGDVGEVFDQRGVEAAEVGELVRDDVEDFAGVVAADGHAGVAHVADSGDGGVEVLLCELRWEKEEGCAYGGDEIYLVGKANGGVVSQDLHWLLETPGKVKGVPFGEIAAKGVEVDNAVFYKGAVDCDIRVEVHTGTEGVL